MPKLLVMQALKNVAARADECSRIQVGTLIANVDSVTRGRKALRLLAGTGREIGVLMVVFAPLESAFAERPISEGRLLAVVTAAFAAIEWGILIETKE